MRILLIIILFLSACQTRTDLTNTLGYKRAILSQYVGEFLLSGATPPTTIEKQQAKLTKLSHLLIKERNKNSKVEMGFKVAATFIDDYSIGHIASEILDLNLSDVEIKHMLTGE